MEMLKRKNVKCEVQRPGIGPTGKVADRLRHHSIVDIGQTSQTRWNHGSFDWT